MAEICASRGARRRLAGRCGSDRRPSADRRRALGLSICWPLPATRDCSGPLGTGLLYIRPGLESSLEPLQQGGTGTRSDEDRQPDVLPDKYESGNLNVPAILGLAAAVEHLAAQGSAAARRPGQALWTRLRRSGLAEIRGVRLFGPERPDESVALVSLTIEGYDPQEVAAALDASFRIQVRPGLHCARRWCIAPWEPSSAAGPCD